MSFISRSDQLFRRLIDRFNLQVVRREAVFVPSTIVPTFDVSQVLSDTKLDRFTSDVAGTGAILSATIPEGERVMIHSIDAVVATGTFTISQIYITNPTVGSDLLLKGTAAQTTLETGIISPFPMLAGWEIVVTVDGYTGAGTIVTDVLYTKEEVIES